MKDVFEVFDDLFTIKCNFNNESSPFLWTVSSGPDNGFNNYCTVGRPYSKRHSNTRQLVNSMIDHDLRIKREVKIVGHGYPGYVETGAGQSGISNQKQLSLWNQDYWKPDMNKAKDFGYYFWIFSCSTGANEDGNNFIHELAKVLNTIVVARTGLTTSNSKGEIWFERGSTQQLGRPDYIHEPTKEPERLINIEHDKIYIPFSYSHVKPLHIKNIKSINFINQNKKKIKLSTSQIKDFAPLILTNSYHLVHGEIAGIITGKFEFTIQNETLPQVITLTLYNNVIGKVDGKDIAFLFSQNLKSKIFSINK